jgi:hypothetical protein
MSDENQNLVDKILSLDENIRFAAIADLDGNMILSKSQEGTNLYLSPESTKDTLRHAATAWKSRMKHVDEIGRGLYTIAVYEKLRRVTMPLSGDRILLVTIDNAGGQKQILDALLNLVVYKDYTYSE